MVWVYGLSGRNSTEIRAGDDLTLIVSHFSGVFQEKNPGHPLSFSGVTGTAVVPTPHF